MVKKGLISADSWRSNGMTFTNKALGVLGIMAVMETAIFMFDIPLKIDTVFNTFLGYTNDILCSREKEPEMIIDTTATAAAVTVKEEVDCHKVLQGHPEELRKANAAERQPITLPDDRAIERFASNCSHFVQHYGFLMDPLTDVEKAFPLAFSIIAYKQASQVVDLLRAVYRPQNFYCIHVDKKSPCDFRNAMEAVSRCFPNVFMASRFIDVHWGFYTVLEPEIVCMRDLWKKKTWKYFINLTGQEFPLKTNYEVVQSLSALKGASNIDGSLPSKAVIDYRWRKFLPAPHNITMYFGPVHVQVSRAFVDYVLHTPVAQDFLKWCQQIRNPDEHFFNSLYYNPHLRVPGAPKGNNTGSANQTTPERPSVIRYKMWAPTYPYPCHKVVRDICILNVLDLPMLSQRKELYANKFYADYSRVALQCLAESLHNRTRDQTLRKTGFNVTL